MSDSLKNVIVIGGSFVGLFTAEALAAVLPPTHRILVVEQHSHLHHLFVFPRYSIAPNDENKAFIPYNNVFGASPNSENHAVIQARVNRVHLDHVELDREWNGSNKISFEYIVMASGTRLLAPGTLQFEEKVANIQELKAYQESVGKAKSVVIIGGGAVGVQMATDMKEIFPEKDVTIIHSRDRVMNLYHSKFDEVVRDRFEELGVKLISGTRAIIPQGGFPTTISEPLMVTLQDGRTVTADLVVTATGQTPNTGFLSGLPSTPGHNLLNARNGFINVKPTLQFEDPKYSGTFFAVGDVADTGAPKTARIGSSQAKVVAANIASLIEGKEPEAIVECPAPAIHITLGLKKNIVFRNPNPSTGVLEPTVIWRDDGTFDMSAQKLWERWGLKTEDREVFKL